MLPEPCSASDRTASAYEWYVWSGPYTQTVNEIDESVNPDYLKVPYCLADNHENRLDYAGYVTSAIRADMFIGRVLDALDEEGMRPVNRKDVFVQNVINILNVMEDGKIMFLPISMPAAAKIS